MACDTCLNSCCIRPCVDKLVCAYECCGCCHLPVLFGPNLDMEAGTIVGMKDSDLRFYPFNPNASDGTQNPLGVTYRHYVTDANGDVNGTRFGPLGLGLECGEKYGNVYFCGIFRTEDLRGDVASAIAARLFRRISGSVDAGLVKVI